MVQSMVFVVVTSLMIWVSMPYIGTLDRLGTIVTTVTIPITTTIITPTILPIILTVISCVLFGFRV